MSSRSDLRPDLPRLAFFPLFTYCSSNYCSIYSSGSTAISYCFVSVVTILTPLISTVASRVPGAALDSLYLRTELDYSQRLGH